jgi:hypothetical protein
MPHVIAWDLETIPDVSGFPAANDLFGKSPDEVRGAMGDKFPKQEIKITSSKAKSTELKPSRASVRPRQQSNTEG